jgi:hypothetical protein
MSAMSRNKGARAEVAVVTPLCAECVEVRVPSLRHTYCPPCAKKRAQRMDRKRAETRLKGCLDCGGPNPGRGARYCASCHEARQEKVYLAQRQYANAWREKKRRAEGVPERDLHLDGPPGTKWCNFCNEHRDFDAYRVTAKGQLAHLCRPCEKKYQRQRRLDREYGLSVEDYEEMLEDQLGLCAICLSPPDKRNLAVDHDHETGEVRGLLCTRCNRYLVGASDESPMLLRRAANYLERPPALVGGEVADLSHPTAEQLDEMFATAIGRNS